MNEFEQPDELEHSLRRYYHVRFSDSHGSAPATSEIWQHVSPHLGPGMAVQPWWRRWFHHPSLGTPFLSAPRRVPMRRLAVACALVLGVLLLVSGMLYATSVLGSHQGHSQGLSSTSNAAWQFLLKSSQPGTRYLAQKGLFTQVNQTKGVGSGLVKIQNMYADANVLILSFTADRQISGVPSVTLSDGQTLEPMVFERSDSEKLPIMSLNYFDASSIHGNPSQLRMSVSIPLVGETEHFDLTEPFHMGKTVQINQTVTFSGHTYTFERVVITPYETRLYSISRRDNDHPNTKISIAGKTYESAFGSGTARESFLDFQDDLQKSTGTWTVQVFSIQQIGQITFTVN